MEAAWNNLMTVDKFSTRAYLLQEMEYPWQVVQWMETRGTSTGAYDNAFSEVSITYHLTNLYFGCGDVDHYTIFIDPYQLSRLRLAHPGQRARHQVVVHRGWLFRSQRRDVPPAHVRASVLLSRNFRLYDQA